MHKIFLSGYVANEPVTTIKDGMTFSRFSIPETRKGKDGTEYTTWFNVSCSQGLAEKVVKTFCHKGTFLSIIGEVRLNTYEKDGEKFTNLVVWADSLQIGNRVGEIETKEETQPKDNSDDLPY